MAKKIKEKYTGSRVVDTDTFIQKARWAHGDKYDYSRVEYVNQRNKVTIICPRHGVFMMTPTVHIDSGGCGCRECRKESLSLRFRKTTEDFIKQAKDRHGDKYDYSKAKYGKNGREKVTIICPDHGEFQQAASSHILYGCPKCGYTTVSKKRSKSLEDFLISAKKVHEDKYDYSKVTYVSAIQKVTIICPDHGEFQQTPNGHCNQGQGCPVCANLSHRISNSEFIVRAKEHHGDKYEYIFSEYKGAMEKVVVFCKNHGKFKQTAIEHLRGKGCPECAKESSGFGQAGYYGTNAPSNLYILNVGGLFIKVGLAKKIHGRMNTISEESGYSVEKLYSISGKANELFELEQKILRKSNLKRFYPEVSFGGQSECLHLSELPKVLDIIEDWEKNQQSEEKFEESP